MDIFIDESGNFAPRDDGSTVAVLGALVVTESQIEQFERRYKQLRPLLPKDAGEVKGRVLNESDVARVVDVVRRSGLIYEVTVVDLPAGSASLAEAHRAGQCEGITAKLTDAHHPNVVESARVLRTRLEKMPLQLYVQSAATFDLLWRTLAHATLYYCQREPHALARFRWIIDAKASSGATDAENWWAKVVKPVMQSWSLQEPFPRLEEGDYSHFAAKEMLVPDYLAREFPRLKGATGLRLAETFDEITFCPDANAGLEVVDVLTNAVRRAVTGRLGRRGWQGIAGTMIHRSDASYVHAICFGQERAVTTAVEDVLRRLGQGGRSMSVGD